LLLCLFKQLPNHQELDTTSRAKLLGKPKPTIPQITVQPAPELKVKPPNSINFRQFFSHCRFQDQSHQLVAIRATVSLVPKQERHRQQRHRRLRALTDTRTNISTDISSSLTFRWVVWTGRKKRLATTSSRGFLAPIRSIWVSYFSLSFSFIVVYLKLNVITNCYYVIT